MKAIIAGGGTGGHLFPGIAVAKEIKRRRPDAHVLFVGARQGIETRVVHSEGFELETLLIGGIKGVGPVRRLRNLFGMAIALVHAMKILSRFRPDVVVGVGGYASVPILLAAICRGLPRIIMEQNVYPGLANRVLGHGVNFTAVADVRTATFFGNHGVVTGNPVRKEFLTIAPKIHQPPYTVLVLGGSQGASSINKAMLEALPFLKGWEARLTFIHQTGAHQHAEIKSAYDAAGFEATVEIFFDKIYESYNSANLLISRAGATSVAEIKAAGRAAILIPFKYATDDHQRLNAKAMVENEAAHMIDSVDLTGQRLASEVIRLLEDKHALCLMERNAKEMAVLDAESRIVDLIERAVLNKGKKGK